MRRGAGYRVETPLFIGTFAGKPARLESPKGGGHSVVKLAAGWLLQPSSSAAFVRTSPHSVGRCTRPWLALARICQSTARKAHQTGRKLCVRHCDAREILREEEREGGEGGGFVTGNTNRGGKIIPENQPFLENWSETFFVFSHEPNDFFARVFVLLNLSVTGYR